MKKKLTALFACLLSLCLLCFSLTACGGVAPMELTLDKTTTSVFVDEGTRLTVKLSRDLTGKEEIAWSSSNDAVATVQPSGKSCTVKGVSNGTATVTVSVGEAKATCEVTVSTRRTMTISETAIKLDLSSETKTYTLTAECSDGSPVEWSSSDTNVATVEGGLVTAIAKGTATITAKVDEASASCTVTVVDPNAPVEYDIQKGTSNATVAGTPGEWFYFAKTSGGSEIEVASATYKYAPSTGAEVTYALNFASEWQTVEDPNTESGFKLTENYLRYQPEFAVDTAYTFSCKLSCNYTGYITIGESRFDVEADGTVEVFVQATVSGTVPLNIKVCFFGGSAAEPLATPIVVHLTEIEFALA